MAFIDTAILGYALARFVGGKKAGERGKLPSLTFRKKNHIIHLHHWFISFVVIVMLFAVGLYSNTVYGFLTGLVAQGLTYGDFYKVVYKKADTERTII